MNKDYPLGKRIFHYRKIDSTQEEIKRRIDIDDIENGDVIISDIQTKGIGTHGRKWYTDFKNNIAFSLYIEIGVNLKYLDGITIKIAEILKEILKDIYDVELEIKMPNDLVLNAKKIAGILTETKVISDTVKYMIVGIGMNTNQLIFNEEIVTLASSIKKELGIDIDNYKIINEFLLRFEKELDNRIGDIQ